MEKGALYDICGTFKIYITAHFGGLKDEFT